MENGSRRNRWQNVFHFKQYDVNEFARVNALSHHLTSALGKEKMRVTRVPGGLRIDRQQMLPMVGDKPRLFFKFPTRGLLGRFTGVNHTGGQFTTYATCAMPILINKHNLPGIGHRQR
jgi:hypothetical protein